jgi:pyruvate ferredoxin oxidoreductase delta subunit
MPEEKINQGAAIIEPGSSKKNKTGSWRTMRPVIQKDKCKGCGLCSEYCPDSAIKISKNKKFIDYDYCKGCGICSLECPNHAMIMVKEEK